MAIRPLPVEVIDRLVENPYCRPAGTWADDVDALTKFDLNRALQEAFKSSNVVFAEKLVLAHGRITASLNHGDPKHVLPSSVLNSALAAKLPRRPADYIRLCTAAARCESALARILGISDAAERLRHDVWVASFGRSLYHALFLERVARDDDVLILGETGTGKEAIANSLIAATPGGPGGGPAASSTINAAALPETLVESELFGYVKGAFTGATETRAGRILSADGGCFFLDEVGDLPAPTQVKLLRVLESDEISPLGSDEVHRADVRFVAATHRDLEAMVHENAFRPDLYQRLAGNIIRLPPLRERPEDIAVIGMAFVRSQVPAGALDDLVAKAESWLTSPATTAYAWPGNVRELQNVLRGVLLGVAPKLTAKGQQTSSVQQNWPVEIVDATASLEQASDWYLSRVLEKHGSNLAQSAKTLGVDRSTVRRHLKRLRRSF